MLIRKSRAFILSLTLLAQFFLSSCVTANYNNCPTFPIGGAKVADELEKAGELPNTWEWIARLYKLKQELDLCETPTAP